MVLAVNKSKNKNEDVLRLVKTKLLNINYSKPIHSLFINIKITKHINLSTIIGYYYLSLDYGYLSLGFEFNYKLKNIDHKGISLIINLILLKIEIDCSDYRHIEDYKNKE